MPNAVTANQPPSSPPPPRFGKLAALLPAAVVGYGSVPITAILALVVCLVACCVGAIPVAASDTMAVIGDHLTGRAATVDATTDVVVWRYRIPRVLLAALCGAGLAVCGAVMQTVVGNPLADPYILGVSSGAAFGVVLGTLLLGSAGTVLGLGVSGIACAAALITVAAVLALGQYRGVISPLRIVLAGVAFSYLLTALTSFAQLWATPGQLRDVMFWSLGSVTGATWPSLGVVGAIVAIGLLVLWFLSVPLNAMTAGDDTAQAVGVSPGVIRWAVFGLASIITAVLVMYCGGVGFVGLIVPHAVRLVFGVDHRLLLPLVALWGAIFLVTVDTAARVIFAPAEVPLGVVTAMLGAPVFLVLMNRAVTRHG